MTTPSQPAAQRLLRACRELLERDLSEWLDELGPQLDEELFELANSTRADDRRNEYFRLRSAIPLHWGKLTEASREQLVRELQPVKAVDSRPQATIETLTLVDDRELTERILARDFINRVSEFCSEETYTLDRRMTELVGNDEMAARGNRFGPAVVCNALRSGTEAFSDELDMRNLLLRQLEKHLRSELPALYRALNEILIEGGILPDLKRNYGRGSAAAPREAAAASANILETLQRLARARAPALSGTEPAALLTRAAAPPAFTLPAGSALPDLDAAYAADGASLTAAAPVVVSNEFLASLKQLQALPSATEGSLTNTVRLARASEAARAASPLDAITMDIVATLFDMIFDDTKVAESVKAMVSRLQIPVLKVAMLDQSFFAERNHPARRFLDSISGISIRWGSEVNPGDPFYRKLSELIERIQAGFDEDVGIFGTALHELSEFVSAHEAVEAASNEALAEHVLQQAEERQQQLEAEARRKTAAETAAEAALSPLLAEKLPLPIAEFLQLQWRAVLVKLALDEGLDSKLFATAGRVAAALAWSVTPKKSLEDQQRLTQMLPQLISALHQGLDRLQIATESRQPLFDTLVTLHTAALHADKRTLRKAPSLDFTQVARPEQETACEVSLRVEKHVEAGVEIENVALVEPPPAPGASVQNNPWLRRIKLLVRGDWVEFIDHGVARRERLTWLSPQRSLYLFSNHATQCAISITPEALAHRLQNETARLVEIEEPLFERALDGAIKALDQAA